jgi:hypothetical protein
MINILSIRCALAFAPYIVESAKQFLDGQAVASRVARQGGNGLIIWSDGRLILRHQSREATLTPEEAHHYRATVRFRIESYDINLMQDEVVMSSFGDNLVLSHPQSELWLEAGHITEILCACEEGNPAGMSEPSAKLPDWLNISTSAGQLLMSDQRNGRWVLLGSDHLAELGRRLDTIAAQGESVKRRMPPVIQLKNIKVHLQSAFKLADTLDTLASGGEVASFEEVTPSFTLGAKKSVEGIELRDSDNRVGLTAKEARKWAEIIRSELERLNAVQAERGGIRTVFADGDGGRWVLQWGDEVFVPEEMLALIRSSESEAPDERMRALRIKRDGEFLLLLSEPTAACVALSETDLTSF